MLPLLLAAAVSSTDVPPPDISALPIGSSEPKLRNGLVLGLSLGGGVGQGRGYPNNSQDIGDPADYSSSGWGGGAAETLIVMGALTDYLSFGFFVSSAAFHASGERASETGVGLRIEAFPFTTLVPALAGLGAFSEFGLGTGKLETSSLVSKAQGTQSFVGAGAFYEWSFGHALGGHFAVGPSLEYDAMWARPYQESGLIAAARFVFYGGD